MSKPVFEDLYEFSGRRNRKSYILLLLAQIGIGFVLSLLTLYALTGPYILLIGSAVGFIALAVSYWANGSQRIRDTGHSGVWILLTLVPYIGWIASLAICFIPSSEGENRYGPSCI